MARGFENSPKDKEPKGMKEGSKAEEKLDAKQAGKGKRAAPAKGAPFPFSKTKGK